MLVRPLLDTLRSHGARTQKHGRTDLKEYRGLPFFHVPKVRFTNCTIRQDRPRTSRNEIEKQETSDAIPNIKRFSIYRQIEIHDI